MKQTLESRIGYHFHDPHLLETAMTHSSYANERHAAGVVSYERLEFLGDSVLGLTAAEFLYAHRPVLPEGRMTRLRAELVCEASLHKTALQELVQRRGEVQIRYDLIGETGPDHNKTFSFSVSVDGKTIGEGSGRTKKEAEQMAARCALEKLGS